jgi:hypothetical protein
MRGKTMTSSKINGRFGVRAGAISIVALALLTSAGSARANAGDGPYSPPPGSDPRLTQPENPYVQDPNPLGFQGLGSADGNADEGTLQQSPRQIDSEVGAGEHSVIQIGRGGPESSNGVVGIVKGALIIACLAVGALGIRLLFYPAERVPKIGPEHEEGALS